MLFYVPDLVCLATNLAQWDELLRELFDSLHDLIWWSWCVRHVFVQLAISHAHFFLVLAAARTHHARMLIVSHACRFYCSPSLLLVVLAINVCYCMTTCMLAVYFVAVYYASLISLSPSCMLIINTCSPSLMLSVARAHCLSCSMAFVSLSIILTVFHECYLCSWSSLAGCNPGAMYVILCSWVHLLSLQSIPTQRMPFYVPALVLP
jgi:hypothetical protein